MAQFFTFARFFTEAEAGPLVELLQREKIPFEMVKEVNQLDPIYLGNNLDPMIAVNINREHFRKVNALLEKDAEQQPISTDHYLNEFSTDELIGVIDEKNEWNIYDRAYAKKLLQLRDAPVPPTLPEQNAAPYQPIRLAASWITLGYLTALFSIIGIFVSLSVLNNNKVLPNGTRVKMYDSFTLGHARNILVISCISLALVAYRLFIYPASSI